MSTAAEIEPIELERVPLITLAADPIEADDRPTEASPIAFWRGISAELPHLDQHVERIVTFIEDFDAHLRRDDVHTVDFSSTDTWYRFHGSFNFLPVDRADLFTLAADKLDITRKPALMVKGNLYHEVALMQTEPEQALIFLQKAQDSYALLKNGSPGDLMTRQALAHWHDAEMEKARQRHHLDPHAYTEEYFAARHREYIEALEARINRDNERVKHIEHLAADAWEAFGVVAYNDALIQSGLWRTRSARSAFEREDAPLYGVASKEADYPAAGKLGISRSSFDIVISDSETGIHVPIQMKSSRMDGRAYDHRIHKVFGQYVNRQQELIDDILASLDAMAAQYTDLEGPVVQIDEAKTESLSRLRELAKAAHLVELAA